MALSGKQRRYLRSLGHHLEPVVHIGKQGLDGGVIAAVDRALLDHELVKLKVGPAAPMDRDATAAALAAETGAHVAQILGGSVLLYRPHPDKPTIKLPARTLAARPAGEPATASPADGDDDDDDDDDPAGSG